MESFVKLVNSFLWDKLLIYALLLTGIYYTFRLGFHK